MAEVGLEIANPVTGEVVRFIETIESGSSRMVVEADSSPGMVGPPVHLHRYSDEHFEGLEGVVMLEIGRARRELLEGDTVTVPAGTPHRFFGHPERAGRLRATFPDPRGMEDFLVTMFELARSGNVNGRGIPSLPQLALTISRFDESRVPRPPWPVQRALFGVLGPIGRRRGLKAAYTWGELG